MSTGEAASPHQGGVALPGSFPDDFPGGATRSGEWWDTSHLFPMPKRRMWCPICGGAMAVKDWKFHKRHGTGSASPWRCDVRMKCMTCGWVPMFGVLVSREMAERAAAALGTNTNRSAWVHWRTGRDAMEVEGDA